ncbi:hypothetical protein Poly21_28290 [Allorhodopirellula heiligendammensis]|uniref:Uncharacterized protein n=2 Tax=Allorhodopirellula heiligendammensis TaxID=2714739 RepID=A0A5C6BUV3_9BACT|nr:hypothetical protein Poly21_28290 [Allorhodopirellula heiligendammensis]
MVFNAVIRSGRPATDVGNVRLSQCFILLAFLCIAAAPLGAQSPSAEDHLLSADELRRTRMVPRTYFYGKEFRYKIETESRTERGGATFFSGHLNTAANGVRTLAIGKPSPHRSYIPVRLMHYQENPGEPHIDDDPLLTYFEGTNGRISHSFVRKLLYNFEGRKRVTSFGNESVGYGLPAFQLDPLACLLVNDLCAIIGCEPPDDIEFVAMGDKLQTEWIEHKADRKAIRMSTTDPDDPRYAVFTSGPEYLPLEQPRPPHGPLQIDISELMVFDGFRYPKKATYQSLTPDGTFGYICSIEMLDIREIDVHNFEWIPPWPAGTEWMRERDRKRTHVPYSDAQLASIQQHALANARANAPQPKSSWFFYLNLGLIGLIIAMAVYRFWPRSEPV